VGLVAHAENREQGYEVVWMRKLGKTVRPGCVIATTLRDQSWVYGVCCVDVDIAFSEFRSDEAILNLGEILTMPTAFRVPVTLHGLRTYDWFLLGDVTLTERFATHVAYARRPAGSKQIYLDRHPESSKVITSLQAKNIEQNAVWSLCHIEKRLERFFSGDSSARINTVFDE